MFCRVGKDLFKASVNCLNSKTGFIHYSIQVRILLVDHTRVEFINSLIIVTSGVQGGRTLPLGCFYKYNGCMKIVKIVNMYDF